MGILQVQNTWQIPCLEHKRQEFWLSFFAKIAKLPVNEGYFWGNWWRRVLLFPKWFRNLITCENCDNRLKVDWLKVVDIVAAELWLQTPTNWPNHATICLLFTTCSLFRSLQNAASRMQSRWQYSDFYLRIGWKRPADMIFQVEIWRLGDKQNSREELTSHFCQIQKDILTKTTVVSIVIPPRIRFRSFQYILE